MKLTLLGNRLHVERIVTDRTAGGLHLPESAKDDANTGGPKLYRVLAVGTGRRIASTGHTIPIEVAVGDRVLVYSYRDYQQALHDGTKIIDMDAVLAVFPSHPICEQNSTAKDSPECSPVGSSTPV